MSTVDGLVGAVDVHYPEAGGARAALVASPFDTVAPVTAERVVQLDTAAPYQPGSFFTRELPAIRSVLDGAPPLRLLLVDGYCDLDPAGRPGLGAHVHDTLAIPVIGVAKTAFHTATHAVPVLRGSSTNPLFVTVAGFPLDDAARLVAAMAGPYRLPDALRRVDALARGHARPLPAQ